MKNRSENTKHYLLASDFDQTLSFNDSGIVLSELLGNSRFGEKVAGLSNMNLVQQGGELAYLLSHDPEYRYAWKEHLIDVGKRIRLKRFVMPPDVAIQKVLYLRSSDSLSNFVVCSVTLGRLIICAVFTGRALNSLTGTLRDGGNAVLPVAAASGLAATGA